MAGALRRGLRPWRGERPSQRVPLVHVLQERVGDLPQRAVLRAALRLLPVHEHDEVDLHVRNRPNLRRIRSGKKRKCSLALYKCLQVMKLLLCCTVALYFLSIVFNENGWQRKDQF